MLALLTHLTWPEWRHHPWRQAAALLAVTLGVALAFSVQLINQSALGEFSAAVRSINGQPDFELRGQRGGFDETLYERVAKHPDIALEVHTSQQLVDLQREGFHAGLRQGGGQWRGLDAEPLLDSPMIAVGSPNAARRLLGRGEQALADEPLLGDAAVWESWFALAGVRCAVNPVASFNDAGMMLQAAEQDLGLALARELLVADALRDGRLIRLSTIGLAKGLAHGLWFVSPIALRDWPPLRALRAWVRAELQRSERELRAPPPRQRARVAKR